MKNKPNIKSFALFIAVCLIVSSMAMSCKEDNIVAQPSSISDSSMSISETEKSDLLATLPTIDFEGYEFTALTNTEIVQHSFNVESENSELINDTIYRRNRKIEDRYNIVIKEITGTSAEVTNLTRSSVKAGADEYDVIFNVGHVLGPMTMEGLFYDWYKLENVDISAEWWDQNCIRDLSVAGNLYLMYADYAIHHYALTQVMYFNKKYIEDFELPNPYELVRAKKWTFDIFNQMAKSVTHDTTGDGKLTNDDRWGYTTGDHNYNGLIAAAGVRMINKDENDTPILSYDTEKFYDVYNKVLEIFHADNGAYNQSMMNGSKYSKYDGYVSMFIDGNALFLGGTLYWVTDELKAMVDDYGFVPMPMYEEGQDRYYSLVNTHASVSVVPVTVSNPARTGLILSALAAESRQTLIPAYYEIAIVDKYSRDEDAAEMLDIIRSSLMYDPLALYGWGDLASIIVSSGSKNDVNIASKMEAKAPAVIKAIEKFIENYQGL